MAAASGLVVRGAVRVRRARAANSTPWEEVQIDTSKESDDPAANLRKAEKIQQGRLGPQDPSTPGQEGRRRGGAMAAEAQAELMVKKRRR